MRIDDSTALSSLPHPQLKQRVAQEFESMFASIMLRSMRNTGFGNALIPESMAQKIYTEMLDGEYARLLSSGKGMGLADLILKEFEKSDESPAQPATERPIAKMRPRKSVTSAHARTSLVSRVERWDALIDQAQRTYGVPRDLIASVIAQESAGNPHAVSRAGAKGLMQLMDGTARDLGVSRVFDPAQNIMGGTRYLRSMLDRFGGNERLALAAYNAGPSAVERHKGIPPYAETMDYVERVLGYRHLFAPAIAAR